MGSYRKELLLSLGLVTAQVDLHAVAPSKTSGFHRYCKEHKVRVKNRVWCPEGSKDGHEVEYANIVSGMETAESVKLVDPQSKPEFPKDERLQLVPVPVSELTGFPQGGFYYCAPSSPATVDTWAVFKAVLEKNKVAFVAKGQLRNGDRKLWRLVVFNNYLALQELRYPEDVRSTPEQVNVKPSREHLKLFNQLIEQSMSTWEAFGPTDENKARIEQWLTDAEVVEKPQSGDTPTTGVMDLQAALQAALSG